MSTSSRPEMSGLSRRTLLLSGSAAGVSLAVRPRLGQATSGMTGLDRAFPFALGVASGDPDDRSVVLWTRLAPDPLNGGGMVAHPVPVLWQVASDESFRHVVSRGVTLAVASRAHSVHAVARRLEPGRHYWYRFRAGGEISPVGRTRTLPASAASPDSLRFAVANCQDFQNGYWPGYGAIAGDDLDFVVHLGDYIYEYDPNSRFPERTHTAPEQPGLDQLRTLSDYRNRHAQYRLDPTLQAAHAAHPFWVVPDDHEVENNYANVIDEIDDTGPRFQDPATFAAQRAAAYQAYYEHMPLRSSSIPHGGGIQVYRSFSFGRLARVVLLDTRQYRTDQPGGFPNDFGPQAAGDGNVAGTLTGELQETWLTDELRRSTAVWTIIGQQTIVARTRFLAAPPNSVLNLDQWDGYGPFRDRLLGTLTSSGAPNPVVLTGDIHSSWVNDLRSNFDDPASIVGTEFVSTSLSSGFPAALIPVVEASNRLFNPHVKYFEASRRGYLRCSVDQATWTTQMQTSTTIDSPAEPVTTSATWVVEAGRPGALPG